ncbi:FG-GAP-like repeat-containing protein [Mucilaginibacter ginkgonis]|uniref:VCBS repeat-containing protein n=1 Tax=Mucilaginibacter ginkgonis TaxID=2682091 RepID=A0A6I4INJ6_9SPHI|nr:FG-GAP-like repeat-containing protein [Mucilaginibacter ginkgonis]QQL49651.1 VCBS repeat-containing protein [Mucilaginibacter ginkgonis]
MQSLVKGICNKFFILAGIAVLGILFSCKKSSHEQMIAILKHQAALDANPKNPFNYESLLKQTDSLLMLAKNKDNVQLKLTKGQLLLKAGREQDAVNIYESVINKVPPMYKTQALSDMAIAYMRLGERTNCMQNHNGSSCIFPIKDGGLHKIQTGSRKAIEIYKKLLTDNPKDYESKWLLNIAYMTLGGYPQDVPAQFLLKGLNNDGAYKVKPYKDMAADLGLDINGMSGGVIVDDFNNDGYLDIITSGWGLSDPMHYFRSNKNGTFTDVTKNSGLTGITGGLNITQTDYNNDGNIDIYVMRGAWRGQGYGNQPSSLLRNNGDGTFTDVTIESGLLAFHPTQTCAWADFNNDGWLDLFVGYENLGWLDEGGPHPCALFINNHDGTFTNKAAQAHCDMLMYVKGAVSADFNKDGWPDIFLSCLDGKRLLKNKRKKGELVDFEDVTVKAGINNTVSKTFSTFFFDYNNDGWPDIIAGDFNNEKNLGYFAGAEASGDQVPGAGYENLFKNNGDGTFTDVTKSAGLDKVVFAMGTNFGDINNDGWPDMYFGTGNPSFKSLVPNKLFMNIDGKKFADVTTSSRIGNLQKGHAVAFADLRNTGLQDIFIEMGGAYKGDSYTSSLYVNPGQNNNNWISLKLEGKKANKAAIGSHIKVTFTENGKKRSVYKDVNSGGSFGSSPLRQEIGIGTAKIIDEIDITWAGSNTSQHFKNIKPNQYLHLVEGESNFKVIKLNKLTFKSKIQQMGMSMPM